MVEKAFNYDEGEQGDEEGEQEQEEEREVDDDN